MPILSSNRGGSVSENVGCYLTQIRIERMSRTTHTGYRVSRSFHGPGGYFCYLDVHRSASSSSHGLLPLLPSIFHHDDRMDALDCVTCNVPMEI